MSDSCPRVMWLLNHTTARRFEVELLKRAGIREIFLPKSFPQDIGFRSASVDYSEDAALSIPESELAILNGADWYSDPGRDAWDVANRHFDVIFCMMRPAFLRRVSQRFRGAVILRAYGLSKGSSYAAAMAAVTHGLRTTEKLGARFWLGTAYDCLTEGEPPWLQSREVYLPLGLHNCSLKDEWNGGDSRVFFVCPDIEGIPYYASIYKEFRAEFSGFPYVVGGAQALQTQDPNVLGFVSAEEHHRNMRELRVMYYHSTEPNHIHYHPLEAVKAGMPLVFMAGGMLDKLGGSKLPGRCLDYAEARQKLRRILANDRVLIDAIRSSQPVLLEKLCPDVLLPFWQKGLDRLFAELRVSKANEPPLRTRSRVAVIVPVAYRGGTLRSAKLLAKVLYQGSRDRGEDVDVVLAYPAAPENEPGPEKWDADVPEFIARRPLHWVKLQGDAALRAMRYAGHKEWVPSFAEYIVPDDKVHNFLDCDLWIVVSDRLSIPLLPIRPYLMMVFDYVQRYEARVGDYADATFLNAAHSADKILVTTRFTEFDALTYAGISRENVVRVPMLAPRIEKSKTGRSQTANPYFLWTTNLGSHKNHLNALSALEEYYAQWDGALDCCVTGVDSEGLLKGGAPHLEALKDFLSARPGLSWRLRILGELPDAEYQDKLAGASFLWHPTRIDNGTLSVVEAAAVGVPSLSSKYPAMEEMNEQFDLHLEWMNSQQPGEMASRLKWMEEHHSEAQGKLSRQNNLAIQDWTRNAAEYWSVIRECL